MSSHVVPWSYSKVKLYESCAARYRYRYIEKLPSAPPGPAAQRGIDAHAEIEKYIKGYGSWEVPPGPEYLYPVLDKMRFKNDGWTATEYKLGFDIEWKARSYLSDTTWGRVVLDAVWLSKDKKTLEIYEWKTGKPRDEYADQRKLYAAAGLAWWEVEKVTVTTVYLDSTAPNQRLKVARSALPKLHDEWATKVERIEKDETFAPNPTFACRWCDYSRFSGGPCRVG